ncbi:MAG TPA: SDR family NAD(P)-dependent oxidoreductase [Clostridiales bacterium]|nr:SDR family NAD(P)-dependent oxidoreductase [Clostridiales bacterium]
MERNILITGASRGLGFFFVQKYLEDGDTVFAGVRNLQSPGIVKLKEAYPKFLIPVELEVRSTKSVDKAVELVKSYTDRLDIIVNNAAVHSESSFEVLEKADIDECLDVYDINGLGPIRVAKAFVDFVRKSPQGKIINISSESGSLTTCKREKEFDYCMSKAALNMGTKLLANYLKKDNILVLSVHPGWMRTDMGGKHAHLDPYKTACKLVELFDSMCDVNDPIFIDNTGKEYPW